MTPQRTHAHRPHLTLRRDVLFAAMMLSLLVTPMAPWLAWTLLVAAITLAIYSFMRAS